ncbi:hypothetical protein Pcinc_004712 [Petrolisthes cinctipes]|uniref:Uncharacterized protein n=1 Tax=Petrolisthes cinctipes TaxID=88211 RepID=A0AAE1L0U7_PETCI|nr:hypothetical protein Pcinc_004712 [Petrolisthes cinctipes]
MLQLVTPKLTHKRYSSSTLTLQTHLEYYITSSVTTLQPTSSQPSPKLHSTTNLFTTKLQATLYNQPRHNQAPSYTLQLSSTRLPTRLLYTMDLQPTPLQSSTRGTTPQHPARHLRCTP